MESNLQELERILLTETGKHLVPYLTLDSEDQNVEVLTAPGGLVVKIPKGTELDWIVGSVKAQLTGSPALRDFFEVFPREITEEVPRS